MRTDVNGCSTTAAGKEQYEEFDTRNGMHVQYDYRTEQGELFSCVAKSLEEARARRDAWIKRPRKTQQEIEHLKDNWRSDPCWDIEETEGFEEHYEELRAYRIEIDEAWRQERAEKINRRATELNCSTELAEYTLQIERRMEKQITDLQNRIERILA